MAESRSFSDDISGLWGTEEGGPLEPARNGAPSRDPVADAAPTNGTPAPVVEAHAPEAVAALSRALAAHQVDVVSKAELRAVRAELEGAFTHQLAVALYELLAASNDRFASAEGHIDQRLDAIADRLAEAVESRADRLAATIEALQGVSADEVAAVRSELVAMREQLTPVGGQAPGPGDALVAFQREIRHEVGRFGDMVAEQGASLARRADADAQWRAADRLQLSERLERSETGAVEAADRLGDVSERLTSLQDDVSTLREAITDLRQAVGGRRRKGRRRR